ncbi:MAG: GNAT family N-acetyltransferase [Lachnospiraceae bacterium]|nr:GNAT family N-acetyltransferase [Lachnospiraceae bacterium]
MINLREVNHSNWMSCIELDVHDFQRPFVNPNIFSLAEAYAHSDINPAEAEKYYRCIPKAIYNDDELIGFTLITYEKECDYDDTPAYEIYRLMIDKKYQQQGYGKEAVRQIIDYIKSFPYGEVENIYACWHPENMASQKLCLSLGFEIVGKDDDGAIIGRLAI